MKLVVSRAAKQDFLRFHRYLSAENPAAADRIVRAVDRLFSQMRDFPHAGTPREDLLPGLRSRPVGTLVVFYRVQTDRILVLRVIDARMDVDREFRR